MNGSKWSLMIFFCLFNLSLNAQFTVSEIGLLPEAVSNNAVEGNIVNGVPFAYSFSGIDESKSFLGIHLKTFKINLLTGESIELDQLPDSRGKIAMGASRVGDIIYITGGYSVASNGSETTFNRVHRFDTASDTFMNNAAPLLARTDDHVQAVWRDSLIYVITGWDTSTNIPDVQFYTPETDTWTFATPIPNTNEYKSFGASGTIVGDTIYYFGGASSAFGFNIQGDLRIGIINPENPAEISWNIVPAENSLVGYRMACANVNGKPRWIGGSETTYNFDGIAYNGSGGVEPANRIVTFDPEDNIWTTQEINVPMDLRGIYSFNESEHYILGGMIEDQVVSNKVLRIKRDDSVNTSFLSDEDWDITLIKEPHRNIINFKYEDPIEIDEWSIVDLSGNTVKKTFSRTIPRFIFLDDLTSGQYFFKIQKDNYIWSKTFTHIE